MKIVSIVGARPQFVKAGPVSRALRKTGFDEILVHTGQHFDASMSDIFFEELDIPRPNYNLDVHGLSHGAMTGRMLEGIEDVLKATEPSAVLIYGDTNSTLAGALAAAKLHIPIAHVEAGLRSYNKRMPEEQNRVLADHLSTWLLCPTKVAIENLAKEGLKAGVELVGDVMYDVALVARERAEGQSSILKRLELQPRGYSVATLHRAENTDDPLRFARVIDYLESQARSQPVVMPVHPRTRKLLDARPQKPAGIMCIEPLGYIDMTWLVCNSAQVLTDSGGLQKEAYFHKVPCVTLRDETEWVETVHAGWNRLWSQPGYAPQRVDIPDYGEGNSAEKIADLLAKSLC
jgi:UDP-GlcNAc3NAcA epimerase